MDDFHGLSSDDYDDKMLASLDGTLSRFN